MRSNVLIRSNKYLVSELKNSTARIFSILLFITCVYYLGRIPSPILTKKLKETSETEERGESEEETDVEIETTSETKGTKQEQEGSAEEDPSPSLFSKEKEDPDKIDEFKETRYKNKLVYETYYLDVDGNQENSKLEIFKEKKDKDLLWFEKPLVTILFDYKRWNRPFRYIKNDRFENAVRNEMSQYFFHTCQSDGKERISFTYPPSLSTFFGMIQKKMSLFIRKTLSSDELYNQWSYKNEQKRKHLNNQFFNRVKTLDKFIDIDKKFKNLDVLEKRTRLCNDKIKKEYLTKIYDPFLNGPYRGRIKKGVSPSIINKTSIKNNIEKLCINKIHSLLLILNYLEFEQKKSIKNIFDIKIKSFEIQINNFFHFLNLNKFTIKSPSSLNLKTFNLLSQTEQSKMDLEKRKKRIQFLFYTVLTDSNNKTTRTKSIGIKEISKKVSQWSYKLINELEQIEGETEESIVLDHEIRSRRFKRVIIFNKKLKNTDTYPNFKESENNDETDDVALIRYSQQSDFRRNIIKGSRRVQRRKTVIWTPFEANTHSPLFLDRIDKVTFFSFSIFEPIKIIFKNWVWKTTKFKISDYTEKKIKENEKKKEEDKRREKERIKIAEAWDSILFAQVIRSILLVTQSFFRKYILLPLLIIAKNSARILLFQFPEWSDDLKDWNKEIHIKCTYNGIQLSEKEFPKNWLTDGIQIKVLFPFHLKPWHKFKTRKTYTNPTKNKGQKNDFCFLTVLGMETELPFGSPQKQLSFFEPIFTELKKKIRKLKKKGFQVIRILKENTRFFFNASKKTKKWISQSILILKKIIKELSKINLIPLFGLREIYQVNNVEIQKEKDSKISNEIIHESPIQVESTNWINYSLTKKKIQDLTNRTNTILNKIEKITKEKKKRFIPPDRNIRSKKIISDDKRLEVPTNLLKIFKRRNVQLIRKVNSFQKIFIEKIYIDMLLGIKNLTRKNTPLFLESRKKIININKSIYNTQSISNDETNQERIDKTKQNRIHFISTIKKPFYNISNKNKSSQTFYELSYLSQAYVFYKLSQTPVFNFSKLRSVFQYNATSFFLKNEIKDYFFGTREIFHSELKPKNFSNFEMNQWQNWLKSHYQYDLSQIRWSSKLVPKKWRDTVNHHSIGKNQNKYLNKCDSYKKTRLINYKKQKKLEEDSLPNQKKKFKKQYRYDNLSYKFINDEDKKTSSIYRFPLQINNNQDLFYNYNVHKRNLFNKFNKIVDTPIHIHNYLLADNIRDRKKNPDRKYFDWIIINFGLKKKVDSEAWINMNIDTNRNKYTKNRTNNYQIIEKIAKKVLFFLPIYQNKEINLSKKKTVFDWLRMNDEILSCPISNLELWFFSEFLILYNVYNIKPWTIPIKLLLFNVNENKGEKESADQTDFESVFSHHEKAVEENYVGSKNKKDKKQYRIESEFGFFLKRYLHFQLRWDDFLNQKMIDNIKVYCLLLRLINPKEITISSIQRREMNLDILMVQKDLTFTELIKKGILLIDPVPLSIKKEGQFIMYQTLSISLVHKTKQTINKRYRAKGHVDKKNSDEFIPKYQKITGNRDKKNYDLFVPETIFSPRRRRELRILICFNSKNKKDISKNTRLLNGNKATNQVFDKNKKEKNKLIKLKLFLWPNYRLEDLACMNRYWFDTTNGSRFSMVRIDMYPRLKINN
uniref:Protein TIC 214 n=1 Tax=Hemiptelea davidii TaxID=63068 RepID=A0A3G6IP36_9ROSA|nr:Ycf1 [Hemiptelea davidii]